MHDSGSVVSDPFRPATASTLFARSFAPIMATGAESSKRALENPDSPVQATKTRLVFQAAEGKDMKTMNTNLQNLVGNLNVEWDKVTERLNALEGYTAKKVDETQAEQKHAKEQLQEIRPRAASSRRSKRTPPRTSRSPRTSWRS